jgi:lambda repressor-like predicted transcriptional regulator
VDTLCASCDASCVGVKNVRLARALAEANLTYWQAAGELGVDPKTVQRWIATGRRPREWHRYRLAKLVGVPDEELWPSPQPVITADEPTLPRLGQVRNGRLYEALEAAGMSLQHAAGELEVDPKTVERWLTEGRVPYPRNRRRLARLLGVSESYLWPRAAGGGIGSEPGRDRAGSRTGGRRARLPA